VLSIVLRTERRALHTCWHVCTHTCTACSIKLYARNFKISTVEIQLSEISVFRFFAFLAFCFSHFRIFSCRFIFGFLCSRIFGFLCSRILSFLMVRTKLQMDERKLIEAARRTHDSPSSVSNIMWSPSDVVEMDQRNGSYSHPVSEMDHILILSPSSSESDPYYHAGWEDDNHLRIRDVRGASWNNQITLWGIKKVGDSFKVDQIEPKLKEKKAWRDLMTRSHRPENFTFFGLYIGEFKVEEMPFIAFREFYPEMGDDALPKLRAIPASKLLVNVASDRMYRFVSLLVNWNVVI